jgi:hypothetical protein
MRHAVAQVVQILHYKTEGCGFDSWRTGWNFLLTLSFRLHCGSVVDSATNRNVPTVSKSDSLSLLDLSGQIKGLLYLSIIIRNHNFACTWYGCATWSVQLAELHRFTIRGDTRWCSSRGAALQTGRSRGQFPMVSEFLINIILLAALWPWVRLTL